MIWWCHGMHWKWHHHIRDIWAVFWCLDNSMLEVIFTIEFCLTTRPSLLWYDMMTSIPVRAGTVSLHCIVLYLLHLYSALPSNIACASHLSGVSIVGLWKYKPHLPCTWAPDAPEYSPVLSNIPHQFPGGTWQERCDPECQAKSFCLPFLCPHTWDVCSLPKSLGLTPIYVEAIQTTVRISNSLKLTNIGWNLKG